MKETDLICDKCGKDIFYDNNHNFYFCKDCGRLLSVSHLKRKGEV